MSKKVSCPVCGNEFLSEPNSAGLCDCPSCSSTLMITGSMPNYDFVSNFEECAIESWAVLSEAKNLDDQSLEDEITEAVSAYDFFTDTVKIFTDMDHCGYMTPYGRSLAEGVYVLIHSNKYFGYEQ